MGCFKTGPVSILSFLSLVGFCACESKVLNVPLDAVVIDDGSSLSYDGEENSSGRTGGRSAIGMGGRSGAAGSPSSSGAQCNPNDVSTLSNCTGVTPCCTADGLCGIGFFGNCYVLPRTDGGISTSRDAGTRPGEKAETKPRAPAGPLKAGNSTRARERSEQRDNR
jgi:hypothetical protein